MKQSNTVLDSEVSQVCGKTSWRFLCLCLSDILSDSLSRTAMQSSTTASAVALALTVIIRAAPPAPARGTCMTAARAKNGFDKLYGNHKWHASRAREPSSCLAKIDQCFKKHGSRGRKWEGENEQQKAARSEYGARLWDMAATLSGAVLRALEGVGGFAVLTQLMPLVLLYPVQHVRYASLGNFSVSVSDSLLWYQQQVLNC